MRTIHFHTDNYVFSGSEVTLTVLVGAISRSDLRAVLTYQPWPDYETGLERTLPPEISRSPVNLPDPERTKRALVRRLGSWVDRPVRALARVVPQRRIAQWQSTRRLVRIFRDQCPDIVHINNGGFPGAISCNAAAIAARRAGVPATVYVVNNLARSHTRPSRWLDLVLERRLRQAVTVFVTGSVAASESLIDVLGLSEAAVRVIPNTVAASDSVVPRDTARRAMKLDDADKVIVVPARLEQRKGHRFLLDAVPSIVERVGSDVVVLIAGSGPERESLVRYADARSLTPTVRFLGHVDDMASLYASSDVVVLASVANEDFPVAILEAMAAGRAVVATRIAGTTEQVVDGETGYLVEPRDSRALASAISNVLADREVANRMGKAGRKRFEDEYAPDVVIERYLSLYRDLLAKTSVR